MLNNVHNSCQKLTLQITLVILGSRFVKWSLKIARADTFGSDVAMDHGLSMATRSPCHIHSAPEASE